MRLIAAVFALFVWHTTAVAQITFPPVADAEQDFFDRDLLSESAGDIASMKGYELDVFRDVLAAFIAHRATNQEEYLCWERYQKHSLEFAEGRAVDRLLHAYMKLGLPVKTPARTEQDGQIVKRVNIIISAWRSYLRAAYREKRQRRHQ